MTWTLSDLEALEKAIVSGAQRVEYEDKEIEYRSLKEMMAIRDMMRKSLGVAPAQNGRVYAEFSKGLACR